jgi:O-antigen/teichoic acid export membrane protein
MGLAATALSISAMTELLRTGGLHVVLVRMRHGWVRTGGQAFYLGLLINGLVCIAISACSLFIAAYYQDTRLIPLLCILSLTLPLAQFGLVESAWLVRKMRFRRVNTINLGQSLVKSLGQVSMACFGFGVFSVVVPEFPAVLFRVLVTRASTPRFPLPHPRPRTWIKLWKDAAWLNVNGFLNGIARYGTTLAVSLALPTAFTGLFFLGSTLAAQAIFLLGGALGTVFLPVFASVGDDRLRQKSMLFRSVDVLTCIVAPVCVLQAVLARDLFHCFLRLHGCRRGRYLPSYLWG